ncbi:type II secretion system major pseudopilin GspG [Hydrogenophaga defluvii]|uniref:Type II secretion system core protein G n=1 Tax=Hydrogenophaga defluvii TaxID=249410 RepID=A0ABW2S982_9BURK
MKTRTSVSGFTLVELLVVLAILGLLAGLVGPRVLNQFGGSKVKVTKLQIEDFGQALDVFKLDTGRYPNQQEGLRAIVEKPANMPGWNGPYLKKNTLPQDPWGNEYQYVFPGKNGAYDIFSLGADNAPGGEGENADIGNWN